MSSWNNYQHKTESGAVMTVEPNKTEAFGTPSVTIRDGATGFQVTMPMDELDAFVMAHRQKMKDEIQDVLSELAPIIGICPNCIPGDAKVRKLSRGGYKCDNCNCHFGVDAGSGEPR